MPSPGETVDTASGPRIYILVFVPRSPGDETYEVACPGRANRQGRGQRRSPQGLVSHLRMAATRSTRVVGDPHGFLVQGVEGCEQLRAVLVPAAVLLSVSLDVVVLLLAVVVALEAGTGALTCSCLRIGSIACGSVWFCLTIHCLGFHCSWLSCFIARNRFLAWASLLQTRENAVHASADVAVLYVSATVFHECLTFPCSV